ncbi:MAG: hypothetical protein ACREGI_04685 [Candidatus Levyibacteriota bacterium]
MKRYFYSHIVSSESITIALLDLEVSEEEKESLMLLADSTVYHAILDNILSELPETDKKLFLKHLQGDDMEKTWDFLKRRIINVEEKIKKIVKEVHVKLHDDIKEIKNREKSH